MLGVGRPICFLISARNIALEIGRGVVTPISLFHSIRYTDATMAPYPEGRVSGFLRKTRAPLPLRGGESEQRAALVNKTMLDSSVRGGEG